MSPSPEAAAFSTRADISTDINSRHRQRKRRIGETREGNSRSTFRALEIARGAGLAGVTTAHATSILRLREGTGLRLRSRVQIS